MGVCSPHCARRRCYGIAQLIVGLCPHLRCIRGSKGQHPAAPGVDLEQFKDLIGFAAWSAINLPETDPRRDFIRQASELIALIDASPKGGA